MNPLSESGGRLLVWAFFGVVLAVFLWAQPVQVGFERGHHGWVSSHVLAIVGRASLSTGFVGYSVQTVDAAGNADYHYFHRAPFFFSAAMKGLLNMLADKAASRIYVARQAMNVLFVAAMLVAYLVARRLGLTRITALAAVLFAFAGYFLAYYRDLVSDDLPGVLGMLIVVYGIAVYRQEGKRWPMYVSTLGGVSVGLGFAALVVVGLWAVLEAWERFQSCRERNRRCFRQVLASPGTRALVLGVLVSSAHVAYNTSVEAHVRGVPLAQTSVVNGALRRLGLDEEFAEQRDRPFTWSRHGATVLERFTLGLTPYPPGVSETTKTAMEWYIHRLGPLVTVPAALSAVFLVAIQLRRQQREDRPILIVLALSGLLWIAAMKALTLPHSYTAIYLVGLALAVFASVIGALPARTRIAALGVALITFVASHASARQSHLQRQTVPAEYTADFERIAELAPPNARTHLAGEYELALDGSVDVVPGAPYAVGFYLPDSYFAPVARAQYAISRDRELALAKYAAWPLTPGNSKVFLFELRAPAGDHGGKVSNAGFHDPSGALAPARPSVVLRSPTDRRAKGGTNEQ
jgi:hypothetical protein